MRKITIAVMLTVITATAVYAGCSKKCWTDINGTRHCQLTCE